MASNAGEIFQESFRKIPKAQIALLQVVGIEAGRLERVKGIEDFAATSPVSHETGVNAHVSEEYRGGPFLAIRSLAPILRRPFVIRSHTSQLRLHHAQILVAYEIESLTATSSSEQTQTVIITSALIPVLWSVSMSARVVGLKIGSSLTLLASPVSDKLSPDERKRPLCKQY